MKARTKRSVPNRGSIERRELLTRRLKFYSKAVGLGVFACTTPAQGAITVFDIPDVTITNNPSGLSQFIDINPDGGAREWQIIAPGVSNQIRIDTQAVLEPVPGDHRADHSDIGNAPAGNVPLIGEGNQLLSGFADGYYTTSFPAGTLISRATLAPSFYVGLAARSTNPVGYNLVGTGGYVGLEWAFNGPGSTDRRYGWAQVDITPANGEAENFFSATLTAYAFEMTPNTPIAAGAPEPGSLALLACGGGGVALAARRRRRAS